jgi:hypothetical protein
MGVRADVAERGQPLAILAETAEGASTFRLAMSASSPIGAVAAARGP